ncbi:baseplate J/gp47 family protein [Luteibacter sp.]|uniref:baseplate J/gp47 family protein n=1 Tax=Luteibacter sp. TaxID=1886636 RepID=UPI002F41AFE4
MAKLNSGLQGIYGADINLDPDSPDGQMVGLIGQIRTDLEELGEDIYNSLDPDYAKGVWLEQRAAYAGLQRRLASYSYLRDVILSGRPGAIIPAGAVVADANSIRWRSVSSATLNGDGSARVDLRSEDLGAFDVPADTVLVIQTVVLGWQAATTLGPAEVGAEEETDPRLRARFFRSRSRPATASEEAIEAKVAELPDVRQVVCLENYTDEVDADGVPAHGINVVVDGGDDMAIATVIRQNKPAGTNMRGEVVVNVPVRAGTRPIRFDRPAIVSGAARVTVKRVANFTAIDVDGIQAALAALQFQIGEDVLLTRLYTPINTVPGFWVQELLIGVVGGDLGIDNIDVDARSLARFAAEDIEVVIAP